MHIDLMFPSKYMKAADLRGKDATLTIRRVVFEEVKGKAGSEKHWIIYFDEARKAAEKSGNLEMEKRLICKVTVARQIAKALGEKESERWVGKRITLFVDRTNSPQGMVDCIRVREQAPEASATVGAGSVTEPEKKES